MKKRLVLYIINEHQTHGTDLKSNNRLKSLDLNSIVTYTLKSKLASTGEINVTEAFPGIKMKSLSFLLMVLVLLRGVRTLTQATICKFSGVKIISFSVLLI